MKIKFPEAEKFITSFAKKFVGKEVVSLEMPYTICELVFGDEEIYARLIPAGGKDTVVILLMDIDRAAELLDIPIDWKVWGFRGRGSKK